MCLKPEGWEFISEFFFSGINELQRLSDERCSLLRLLNPVMKATSSLIQPRDLFCLLQFCLRVNGKETNKGIKDLQSSSPTKRCKSKNEQHSSATILPTKRPQRQKKDRQRFSLRWASYSVGAHSISGSLYEAERSPCGFVECSVSITGLWLAERAASKRVQAEMQCALHGLACLLKSCLSKPETWEGGSCEKMKLLDCSPSSNAVLWTRFYQFERLITPDITWHFRWADISGQLVMGFNSAFLIWGGDILPSSKVKSVQADSLFICCLSRQVKENPSKYSLYQRSKRKSASFMFRWSQRCAQVFIYVLLVQVTSLLQL